MSVIQSEAPTRDTYLVNVYYQSEAGNAGNWRGTVEAFDEDEAHALASRLARKQRKVMKIDGGDSSLVSKGDGTMALRQKGHSDIAVTSYRAASAIFSDRRDISGEGASTFHDGVILAGATPVARISYNGRVWAGRRHVPEDRPLYDPSDDAARPGGPARAGSIWRVTALVHFGVETGDADERARAERSLDEEIDETDLINAGRIVSLYDMGDEHLATAEIMLRIVSRGGDPVDEAVERLNAMTRDSGLFATFGPRNRQGVMDMVEE